MGCHRLVKTDSPGSLSNSLTHSHYRTNCFGIRWTPLSCCSRGKMLCFHVADVHVWNRERTRCGYHDDFFFRKKQRVRQNTGSFSDCHVDFGGDRGEISRSYGSSHNAMAHRLRVESVRFRCQTFPCRWSKSLSQVEVFTTK